MLDIDRILKDKDRINPLTVSIKAMRKFKTNGVPMITKCIKHLSPNFVHENNIIDDQIGKSNVAENIRLLPPLLLFTQIITSYLQKLGA